MIAVFASGVVRSISFHLRAWLWTTAVLGTLGVATSFAAVEARIDFTGKANRSLADEVEGSDGQKSQQSLDGLTYGDFRCAGIGFTILDEKSNDGRQVLAFGATGTSSTLSEVHFPVGAGAPAHGGTLYLLHGARLTPSDEKKKVGRITIEFDSGKTIDFSVINGRDVADWRTLSSKENGAIAQKVNVGVVNVGIYLSKYSLPKLMGRAVAVRFVGEKGLSWVVVAATISDQDVALPKPEKWKAVAGTEWKPVDLGNTSVTEGSALDLSSLFGPVVEAGANGPVVINEQGKLAFMNDPSRPVRFLCCSDAMITNLRTPEAVASYAEQIKRAGYNMFRCHFLDHFLMYGSKEDLAFNPERLDQWDRLTSELKKRGIYLYLDVSTSWASFYATSEPWSAKGHAFKLKSRLYYDPSALEHWKKGVSLLLEHVNPYTGVALKDEPQVAIVQARNESGLNFLMYFPDRDMDIVVPFRKWLKERYVVTEALRKAWSGCEEIKSVEGTFDKVPLPSLNGSNEAARDLQRFFIDIERQTYFVLAAHLKKIGVKATILDYNNGCSMQATLARDVLPIVDAHAYHDHPTNYTRTGSTIKAISATSTELGYFRSMAGVRQWGAPFLCSEWGQPFWNPDRHEAGLSVPPYAALQGWQMITHFSNPIGTPREAIMPFRLFRDPPLRAAEYMSALLFRRGDVQTSPHAIAVDLDSKTVFEKLRPQDALPASVTQLALVTGIGVRMPNREGAAPRSPQPVDYMIMPDAGSSVITATGAQIVNDSVSTQSNFEEVIGELKKKKILPENNRTSVSRQFFESDTGELMLDVKNRQLQVVTPRSEGVSLAAGAKRASLSRLSAVNLGASSMTCFVGSLTQEPIEESRRLLLILVSDALNENMVFEDDTRRQLVSLGGPEVLMRTVKAEMSLQTRYAANLRLYALGANGSRIEELSVRRSENRIDANIDTGMLKAGPTPYFELVIAPESESK